MIHRLYKHSLNHATVNSPEAVESAPQSIGALPVWDLSDLYSGMHAPELMHDLADAKSKSLEFETNWKGRLSAEAAKAGGGTLVKSIRAYEALEELMGRIISFASLLYAEDSLKPENAKLYGDIQEQLTDASAHLLFYTLELNHVADHDIEAAMATNADLAYYRPWIEDLRKDKPYQLDEKTEQLFLEKAMTGRSAWNRLFDETMTALRFDVGGEQLPVERTLNLLQDANRDNRKAAARKTFALSPS
jgi:oligoendopeptidase F